MAIQLQPLSISAPGFFGLNSQEAAVDLPINWALDATNCIIDQYGRIASRKGWIAVTASALAGTPDVRQIHEYIKSDGTTEILSCAGNKIYVGTTTLTDLSAPGTITADNWKIVNFNNKAYFFQAGHVPLEYDGSTIGYATRGHTAWAASTAYVVGDIRRPTTATPYYYVCTTAGTSGGTEPTWSTTVDGTTTDNTVVWTTYEIPKANAALAAVGRVWLTGISTDRTVVYYSDLLIGHSYYGGSSGSIDLKSVWAYGMDSATTVEVFNGLLAVFGKNSVVIYDGCEEPTTMALVEHIKGIGCIARDSVQDIGDDILFLSRSGVSSLTRAVENDKVMTANVSDNVRDLLLSFLDTTDETLIRSTYNKRNAFYLLTLPSSQYTFCFDTRSRLEDNTFRVTTWDSINPTALCSTLDDTLYLGKPGIIAEYSGYLDNASTYRMQYRSTWQHLDNKLQIKMPKSVEISIIGGFNAGLTLKMSYDYSILESVYNLTIGSGTTAEYGIAEYGIAEYYSANYISTLKYQVGGSGKAFSFAIESEINDNPVSIQKIDILTKLGRMI